MWQNKKGISIHNDHVNAQINNLHDNNENVSLKIIERIGLMVLELKSSFDKHIFESEKVLKEDIISMLKFYCNLSSFNILK